jgi:hypothetical protein
VNPIGANNSIGGQQPTVQMGYSNDYFIFCATLPAARTIPILIFI